MQTKILIAEEAQEQYEVCIEYVRYVLFAENAAKDIEAAFETFLKNVEIFPEMYPIMQDVRMRKKNVRRALVKSYVVVYKYHGETVEIIGFFHQSQDYARFL